MSRGVNKKGEGAPRYLGIKLDRTLTFKQRLERESKKQIKDKKQYYQ